MHVRLLTKVMANLYRNARNWRLSSPSGCLASLTTLILISWLFRILSGSLTASCASPHFGSAFTLSQDVTVARKGRLVGGGRTSRGAGTRKKTTLISKRIVLAVHRLALCRRSPLHFNTCHLLYSKFIFPEPRPSLPFGVEKYPDVRRHQTLIIPNRLCTGVYVLWKNKGSLGRIARERACELFLMQSLHWTGLPLI